jgi:sugar lactone lactonase YvrE
MTQIGSLMKSEKKVITSYVGGLMKGAGEIMRSSAVLLVTVVVAAIAFAPAAQAQLSTTAIKVLGQPDFTHDATNVADASSMFNPGGIAFDTSTGTTKAYVVDRNNNRVLGWSSISSLVNGAPATIVLGQPDFISVAADYNGVTAQSLNGPSRVAVDSHGNVFVSDFNNNRVLVYKAPAGAGTAAFAVFGQGGDFSSSFCNVGNFSAPSPETLCNPAGIAIDNSTGNVWIADYTNARVVEYNSPLVANAEPGSGTTIGQMVLGQPNLFTNACSGVTGQSLCRPGDVTFDPISHGVYVADQNQQRVLFFPSPQTNNETASMVFGQHGSFTTATCNSGGLSADALCTPVGMALDSSSNLYLVDNSNNRILVYLNPLAPPSGGCPSPGVPGCAGDTTADLVFGQAGTFTSNGCNFNNNGGPVNGNDLCSPSNVAIVPATGALWASDSNNNRTLIFNTPTTSQSANLVLGQATLSTKAANSLDAASMGGPQFVAVDQVGKHLYISDTGNHRVLGYKSLTALVTGQAADIVIGQPDFASGGCNFNGVTPQSLCNPTGVAVDSSGNLYVADFSNNRVLEFNTPFGTGQPTAGESASNVWGQGGDFFTNGCNLQRGAPNNGFAGADTLCEPEGIFIDGAQDLWVADSLNDRVLLYYSPLVNSAANIVFGQPNFIANWDNNGGNVVGSPSATTLFRPDGVTVDSRGNVYIADGSNNRVLEYNTPLDPSSGEVGAGSCLTATGTFSGTCTATGVFGQNGSFTTNSPNLNGLSAKSLSAPFDVALDSTGDLIVSDFNNNRLLLYQNPLSNTVSNQVFGQAGDFQTNGCNFFAGVSGNTASPQSLCNPVGLTTDTSGNVYVADFNNRRVVIYDPPVLTPRQSSYSTVARGTSVTKTFTFYSKSLTVNVAAVAISGTSAKQFKVTKDACSGKLLKAKSSCTVQVTFAPTTTGVQKAQLSLYDDAYNSPHRAGLVGSGK